MSKKINFVPDVSNIKLSLILIILICGIIFFVYLRKERFHNITNMINMNPSEISSKLKTVKKCIKNPDSCSQENRKKIVDDLNGLINFLDKL